MDLKAAKEFAGAHVNKFEKDADSYLVVYYRLPKGHHIEPLKRKEGLRKGKDQFPIQFEEIPHAKEHLVINRTDSNILLFNQTFSQDLKLIDIV